MSTKLGQLVIKTKSERSLDNNVGWKFIEEWESIDRQSIDGKAKLYENDGWSVDIEHRGPKYLLRATTFQPNEGTSEEPLTRWSWHKEVLTRPIWTHPAFAAAAASWGNPQEYRKIIEESIEQGLSLGEISALLSVSDVLASIVAEIAQGVDSYETEYTILTRERNTTPEYASKIQLNANGLLYTTDELVKVFNVPKVVSSVLPSDGVAPGGNRVWTWRMRSQSGDFSGPDVFQERQEFVFAAWSTFIYDRYQASP